MKRRMVVLAAVMVVVILATGSYAGVQTKKFPLQHLIAVKTPVDSIGHGMAFQSKGLIFHMTDFIQMWGSLSVLRRNITASVGGATNWTGRDVAFVALKQNVNFSKSVFTMHEFISIFHDGDFFYWGLLDKTFPGKSNPFIGLYCEVSNQQNTIFQIGPHVGNDHFEVDLLLGERSSNLRFSYIIQL